MAAAKPLVQAACVCERVLLEADKVPSLIRVVDSYTLNVSPDAPGLTIAINLTIFISLKSGDVVGEHEIGVRLNTPDATEPRQPLRRWPVEFRGGEHGVNLVIAFQLQTPKTGVYWFDVLWEAEMLTRIPLSVIVKSLESNEPLGEPTETTTH